MHAWKRGGSEEAGEEAGKGPGYYKADKHRTWAVGWRGGRGWVHSEEVASGVVTRPCEAWVTISYQQSLEAYGTYLSVSWRPRKCAHSGMRGAEEGSKEKSEVQGSRQLIHTVHRPWARLQVSAKHMKYLCSVHT